jgi:hypothetical protein
MTLNDSFVTPCMCQGLFLNCPRAQIQTWSTEGGWYPRWRLHRTRLTTSGVVDLRVFIATWDLVFIVARVFRLIVVDKSRWLNYGGWHTTPNQKKKMTILFVCISNWLCNGSFFVSFLSWQPYSQCQHHTWIVGDPEQNLSVSLSLSLYGFCISGIGPASVKLTTNFTPQNSFVTPTERQFLCLSCETSTRGQEIQIDIHNWKRKKRWWLTSDKACVWAIPLGWGKSGETMKQ